MAQKKSTEFQEQMLNLQSDLDSKVNTDQTTLESAKEETQKAIAAKEKTILDLIIEEEKLSQDQIEQWKSMYGKIYAVRFDEGETVIYRYLARPEMKDVSNKISQIKSNQINLNEFEDELIFDKCVLYPTVTPDLKATLKAGTIPTVAFQIRVSSNYLPDAVALDLITRL